MRRVGPALAAAALAALLLPPPPAAFAAALPGPAPAAAITTPASRFVPTDPFRVLDSRSGLGRNGPLGAGAQMTLALGGRSPIPAGITGVALNVTVIDVTQPSYLTVWPADQAWPGTSSLNFAPGAVTANMVTSAVSAAGAVAILNSQGSVDVLADVEGWFLPVAAAAAGSGEDRPLSPARILDTRTAIGGHGGPMGAGETFFLVVAGRGNVPASGAGAALLNVTVTDATASSYVEVMTPGQAGGHTSTVNFGPGQVTCNRVVARLAGGEVAVYNSQGLVNVVVDVVGWITDGSDPSAAGGDWTLSQPVRVVDTRSGLNGISGRLGGPAAVHFATGAPAGSGSALLNLTSSGASTPSYLAVYGGADALPFASDLNLTPGRQTANLAAVRVAPDGTANVFNSQGTTDVIVDLVGYATSAPAPGPVPAAPAAISLTSAGPGQVGVAWAAPASTGGQVITSYTLSVNGAVRGAVPGSQLSAALAMGCGSGFTVAVVASNGAGPGPAASASGSSPQCSTNVIGDVPAYRQTVTLDCEAAALSMALAHEGIGVDQVTLLNEMNIDLRPAYFDSSGLRWGDPFTNFVGNPYGSEVDLTGYGTYMDNVARVAQAHGGQVLLAQTWVPPQYVYDSILDGHPVIAWIAFDWRYHAPGSYLAFDGRSIVYAGAVEHAVTVVGVTPDSVLVNNPLSGQQWVSKATFEAAFATYDYMAVKLR